MKKSLAIRWFSHLKVHKKILVLLSFVIFFQLLLGIFGIIFLKYIQNNDKRDYTYEVEGVYYGKQSLIDLMEIDGILISTLNAEDSLSHEYYIRECIKQVAEFNMSLEGLKKRTLSEDGQVLLHEFELTWSLAEQSKSEALLYNAFKTENSDEEVDRITSNWKDKLMQCNKLLVNIIKLKEAQSAAAYQASITLNDYVRIAVAIVLIIAFLISLISGMYLSTHITYPIKTLKRAIDAVSDGKLDTRVDIRTRDEVGMLARGFNSMVATMEKMLIESKKQNWIKDGFASIAKEMSTADNLNDTSSNAISFLARYVNAGKGALYLLNNEKKKLQLTGTFAFSDRNMLSNSYDLGEGLIGQTALEQKSIYLKHTGQGETIIGGTIAAPATHVYALPLVYEEELIGVFELSTFAEFTESEMFFITESAYLISQALNNCKQNEQIKELLNISKASQREAQEKAQALGLLNKEMEEKQNLLQQQSEELIQSNAQMEEQQQQLEQQKEILERTNHSLEEQKKQLEIQETETNKMNDQLIQSQMELDIRANDLEKSNKYKAEFLANMSHELRTPLNSVILLSQILAKNKTQNLVSGDIEKLKVINNAGNELLRLINDILDLSKIESGNTILEIRDYALIEIIDEELAYFRSLAQEKNLDLIVCNELGDNFVMKGDSKKLSQIIRNFLSNSFKFTEHGSITVTIKQDTSRIGNIVFSVSDTGLGIPKSKQQTIFEAFRQVDGSTSRTYGGTGLGLSIALHLAHSMKGEILLNSEEGKGSCFAISIPRVIKENESLNSEHHAENFSVLNESIQVPSEIQQVIETAIHAGTSDTGVKNILIIEDDINFANSIAEVIRSYGLECMIAETGSKGLHYARTASVSGILLDLGLPDISGFEVLQTIKSDKSIKHIPVHILSGTNHTKTDMYNKGAVGFNQKPVQAEQIESILSHLSKSGNPFVKRVLILEDDKGQMTAVTELLNESGIETIGVTSEESAILQIETTSFDAVIVDLGLGTGSGYNFCKYVKAAGMITPIIIYTGKHLSSEEEILLRKVSDTIVIKSVNSGDRLLDELSLFLSTITKKVNNNYLTQIETDPNSELDLTDKTILVVDDDIKNTFVLTAALEPTGANILTAKNGKEAIDILKMNPGINLVLMDIMMPVMDGYEAMKIISSDPQISHIPMIAATAKALKDDKTMCFECGASDYITKPIDIHVLMAVIGQWIDKRIEKAA